MINKYKDFLSALLVIVISLLLLIGSFGIKSIGLSQIGPEVFPRIISIIILIRGCFILVQAILNHRAMKSIHNGERIGKNELDLGIEHVLKNSDFYPFVINVIVSILYILFLEKIGFLISSGLFIFIQSFVLSSNSKRKIKNIIILLVGSLTTSAVIYLIFLYGFKLWLPEGILG